MLFKRRKKFKPYRCPRLRTKSWTEKVWDAMSRFKQQLVNLIEMLFTEIGNLSENVHLDVSDQTGDGFEFDSMMSVQDDSDMFSPDDDDMVRGMWDPTSVYYPICHSDDHSFTGDSDNFICTDEHSW